MGSLSIWHWIILLVIVVLLFGAGKIPRLMGDVAKGVKAFKTGMKDFEDEAEAAAPTKEIKAEAEPAHTGTAKPAQESSTKA